MAIGKNSTGNAGRGTISLGDYVGSIESFKSVVRNIQRSSLFDVTIPNFKYHTSADDGNNRAVYLKFAIKSATWPEASVNNIEVSYMGRKVEFYGTRNYNSQTSWQTTIILDGAWSIYNDIYVWNQALNGAEKITSLALNSHNNFKVDAYLTAYSTNGSVSKKVMLHGLWPKEIGSLSMGWDNDGALDVQVTWCYDYVTTESTYGLSNGTVGATTIEGSETGPSGNNYYDTALGQATSTKPRH